MEDKQETKILTMKDMLNADKCFEDSEALAGQPLGQYHCPICGCMQVAGLPHMDDDGCWWGFELPKKYRDNLTGYLKFMIEHGEDVSEEIVTNTFTIARLMLNSDNEDE